MKRLVKYYADCGRMGSIDGLFVLDADEYDVLVQIIDDETEIYFGEILGKHSEICVPISEEDISILSIDQEFIEKFIEIMGTHVSGYNPLDYYPCPACGCSECDGKFGECTE